MMQPSTKSKKPEALVEIGDSQGPMSSPMMFYLLLGSVGLSLGATLFMFREVRRLLDNTATTKKQYEETAKGLRELGEQLKKLSEHVSDNARIEGRPMPPRIEEQLPKPEGSKKARVMDGGPKDDPQREEEEEEIEESDSSCDEGVCSIKK